MDGHYDTSKTSMHLKMENNNATSHHSLLFVATILFFSYSSLVSSSAIGSGDKVGDGQLKTYIVHVLPPDDVVFATIDELVNWYHTFLPDAMSRSAGESRMVFTYTEVFCGFAAKLTEEELKEMETKPGFGRAYSDDIIPLHTTHSSKFLGLSLGSGLWKDSNLGKGVIIGLLDTGIVPSHPSFNDDGMPLPPSKWKGRCDFKSGCNRKLIGAVSFIGVQSGEEEYSKGPYDDIGHGTHTSSTAAGNFVKGVNFYSMANGTATGIAPHAHIAMYKVCNEAGCRGSAILAGMDAGVKDGVDILSLSLGGDPQTPEMDPIAIGAFGAAEKGVLVSCSAGNKGPSSGTVTNSAPWILTVAATTQDRSLRVRVKLGNGKVLDGQSLYQPHNLTSKPLPLYYPKSCQGSVGMDARGKIVLCTGDAFGPPEEMGAAVKAAGGVAMILTNPDIQGYNTYASYFPLPASSVSSDARSKIAQYVNTSKNPTASLLFDGTVIGSKPTPFMAYFSSRGPSFIHPNILKPDIAAPGVDILAAWPNFIGKDGHNNKFNMISGTSMAAPHVSGIAVLVKSVHPDWSPAMIKSAIMTTSSIVDNQGEPIKDEHYNAASVYDIGAGFVNASKVVDPGLVYDVGTEEYVSYLCSQYSDSSVSLIARHAVKCSKVHNISEWQLNYPSISVPARVMYNPITVQRTVTNVGKANSTYKVEVDPPKGIVVTVKPETLQFSKVGQKKSFTATFRAKKDAELQVSGDLKWVSGEHVVRSPIVITPPI